MTFPRKYIYLLVVSIFASQIRAQNMNLIAKPQAIESLVSNALTKLLSEDKNHQYQIKKLKFDAKNIIIHNTEKRPSGGVLEVYGKELIRLDVTKPFAVDIELDDIR